SMLPTSSSSRQWDSSSCSRSSASISTETGSGGGPRATATRASATRMPHPRRLPAPLPDTDVESRSLPVPDGLVGERVDAAVAKLLGFSRSFVADVIDAGGVQLDGKTCAKSDRVGSGSWLEVQWQPKNPPTVIAQAVDGLGI